MLQPTRPIFLFVLLCFSGVAYGQSSDLAELEPVEPMTGDVGPLYRSLRKVDPGISTFGSQHGHVYRRADGRDGIVYVAPGVTATYDRSQYGLFEVQRNQFQVMQMIPPNTTFHIGLPLTEKQPDPGAQINELRHSHRIEAYAAPTAVQRHPNPMTPQQRQAKRDRRKQAVERLQYKVFIHEQREAVFDALDQLELRIQQEAISEPVSDDADAESENGREIPAVQTEVLNAETPHEPEDSLEMEKL